MLNTTQWSDFEHLYKLEQEKLVKLTNIAEVAMYILLSQFSADPIEKAFSKLMQGPGRAYFVSVRGDDKLALKKSQFYLIFNKCEDLDSCDVDHSYEKCNFVSNEHIFEMIDNLECIHEKDFIF